MTGKRQISISLNITRVALPATKLAHLPDTIITVIDRDSGERKYLTLNVHYSSDIREEDEEYVKKTVLPYVIQNMLSDAAVIKEFGRNTFIKSDEAALDRIFRLLTTPRESSILGGQGKSNTRISLWLPGAVVMKITKTPPTSNLIEKRLWRGTIKLWGQPYHFLLQHEVIFLKQDVPVHLLRTAIIGHIVHQFPFIGLGSPNWEESIEFE